MIYVDTETIGLSGIVVLIQYAQDNGAVHLHHVWKVPAQETLDLIEWMLTDDVCAFNWAFDSFHLHKLYSILRLCEDPFSPPNPDECFRNQRRAVKTAPCLKPTGVLDLLMLARRGKYQSLMKRDPVRIRRVPTVLADALACELDKRIHLPDIYFARRSEENKHGPRWKVYDIKDEKHFKDCVLSFNPASGLKFLAEHCLGRARPHFDEISAVLPAEYKEQDHMYAPCNADWRPLINEHVHHWSKDEDAQYYAAMDIEDTRDLHHKVFESAPAGDNDSELAWHVGGVHWKGMQVDIEKMKANRAEEMEIYQSCPININAVAQVRAYMFEVITDPMDRLPLVESTKKQILKQFAEGKFWKGTEAAKRASMILRTKVAKKRIELYDKIILAGRLHPVLNVIGTKSSRMSGAGGVNVQGINKAKAIRSAFPLADVGEVLSAGDFTSFEMAIAQGVYDSEELKEFMTGDKKLHAVFGTVLFDKDYDEILETDGTDEDLYTLAKSGVFAKLYFGTPYTLAMNLGVEMDKAEEAEEFWKKLFPSITKATEELERQFCSVDTETWEWSDPIESIDNGLGFKRLFILENLVAKELFKLGKSPPKAWREVSAKVVRRKTKGIQTATGAVQSALLGACLALQSANFRAGGNHRIQSFGAEVTKDVQRQVINLQPQGVHPWKVRTLQVHDEILTVHLPGLGDQVRDIVQDGAEKYKPKIPLIAIDWHQDIADWSKK